MTVENAFGRLKARWRVLIKFSELDFQKTVKMITTCCILHNLCENDSIVFNKELMDDVVAFDNVYSQPNQEDHMIHQREGELKRNDIMKSLT